MMGADARKQTCRNISLLNPTWRSQGTLGKASA
jgi:hypothetical protein